MNETIEPMSTQMDQQQLAQQLVESARSDGIELVGPDGMLTGLTKQVLETALETERTEHLGYKAHDPDEHHSGNSRNGTRAKTVPTEIGPVEIELPRDRDGSFEPQLVKKRQRRLSGIDEIVLSLTARRLTTGDVCRRLWRYSGQGDDLANHRQGARGDDRVPRATTRSITCIRSSPSIHVKVRDGSHWIR